MSLARITPGPKGFDQRTFECGKCEYVHREAVSTEPSKFRSDVTEGSQSADGVTSKL
jgi:hypothetical protein